MASCTQGATGDLKAAKMLFEMLVQIDDHNKAVQLEAEQRGGESPHGRLHRKLDGLREGLDARMRMLLAK